MTSTVTSVPIKVEVIEECDFLDKEKSRDQPCSGDQEPSSGEDKASTNAVLPELVIADTELFVKTLTDVVSDVLSQPKLLSPGKSPSSPRTTTTTTTRTTDINQVSEATLESLVSEATCGQVTRYKVIGTRLRGHSDRTETTPPRGEKRSCNKSPSPSPSSVSTSSDPQTASPISSDPLKGSPLIDFDVKDALRAKIARNDASSPENLAEQHFGQNQLLSITPMKTDPDHVNQTTFPKQHPCPTCYKIFSQKLHLQRHIKSVHDGIRDNLCAFCGKGFMLKSHLMEHIRAVHFKIKNHVCLFCDWKFNRVGDLNRHVKTVHTVGKKPRKRKAQTQEGPDIFANEQKIIDVVSDGSDQDYSKDSSIFDRPLSSNSNSLSPSEQAPLSLTDRYLSDYKKRLVERESERESEMGMNSGSDLEIQEDEIVLFPSN